MSDGFFDLKIFSGVDKEVVEYILKHSLEKTFIKGELLLLEGAPSNGEGYIIKRGRVSIKIKGQKIAELTDGDIVGEIALLNDEERTATVEALEDTEVIILTLDNIIDMINNDDNSINKEIVRRIEENIWE